MSTIRRIEIRNALAKARESAKQIPKTISDRIIVIGVLQTYEGRFVPCVRFWPPGRPLQSEQLSDGSSFFPEEYLSTEDR